MTKTRKKRASEPTRRTAGKIYKKQNTLIHKAMAEADMPYQEHKADWLKLINEIAQSSKLTPARRPAGGAQRKITGLSEMTLGERHMLLVHFQGRGQRLFAPAVSAQIRDWKKGDPDIEYEFREDADPQIRMVYAMWAEMGYRPRTLRGLCWKRFKRDDPRWLDNEQLTTLVNIVRQKAESKGVGVYYSRRAS